jgi:hypothetical protein
VIGRTVRRGSGDAAASLGGGYVGGGDQHRVRVPRLPGANAQSDLEDSEGGRHRRNRWWPTGGGRGQRGGVSEDGEEEEGGGSIMKGRRLHEPTGWAIGGS